MLALGHLPVAPLALVELRAEEELPAAVDLEALLLLQRLQRRAHHLGRLVLEKDIRTL